MFRLKTTVPFKLALTAICLAAFTMPAGADNGLETIKNPGGGEIIYGPLTIQCTLPAAFQAVLREIHRRFGNQPEVGKLFHAKDSDSIATFITLTSKADGSKPITGFVIVTHPEGALPAAALMYDDSDRFSKTLAPMTKLLNEAWHPEGATSSGGARGASDSIGVLTGPAAVQPLNPTPFPDGSGSIGLPDGWHITFARMGGVNAVGPNGEAIHLGVINSGIYDTLNPQAQRQMANANRMGRPYYACPLTGDLVSAFRTVSQQISRQKRVPDPTLTVASASKLPPGRNGLSDTLVLGEMDLHDGKELMVVSMRLGIIRPGALGLWALCVDSVLVPKSLAVQEWPTLTAMYGSWRQNGQMIGHATEVEIGKIHDIGTMVDKRIQDTHAAEDAHNAAVYKHWDNMDKYSKSFQNYQLDNATIKILNTDQHYTLDNKSAAALVEANPTVFDYVQTPDFIKYKDY